MVLVQPVVTVEEEELFAPEHAGEGLAHHVFRIVIQRLRDDRGIDSSASCKRSAKSVSKEWPKGLPLLSAEGPGVSRSLITCSLLPPTVI